jgi:hypothetical protein
MANIDEGILGGFRGKIGTVVGVLNGSTFYMRSAPRKRKKAGPKELMNRAKFKLVLGHLEPIKELVKAGFKDHYTKSGGYRAAFSYNRKHAIAGDETGFYIAPELFGFSGGDLPVAENAVVNLANDVLEISWDMSGGTDSSRSDQLMVLLYDKANFQTLTRIFDGPFRSDEVCSMPIPVHMQGGEADIYIGFVAGDRSAQSDSQYLGRFAV